MTKIIFNYGVMGSTKSSMIVAKTYSLREQGKNVVLLKPEVDTRDEGYIKSRAMNKKYPAYLINLEDGTDKVDLIDYLDSHIKQDDFVFIDETQLLSVYEMETLLNFFREREYLSLTVMFYGLKNNFHNQLFKPIEILLAEADSLEEVKSTCMMEGCTNKATTHLFERNGEFLFSGDEINIGDTVEVNEERYLSVCQFHFKEEQSRHVIDEINSKLTLDK